MCALFSEPRIFSGLQPKLNVSKPAGHHLVYAHNFNVLAASLACTVNSLGSKVTCTLRCCNIKLFFFFATYIRTAVGMAKCHRDGRYSELDYTTQAPTSKYILFKIYVNINSRTRSYQTHLV